eukprot:TRINITY_DN77167_c0_g1_i1.p1 TRINITY_DN77167_c0_g1~~TRINITY_DN77167_c0_g1_i1.p1  ORF type:complete len:338 (+),score=60.26 TRINITY_DN77167_c0_g1_i1:3-1016(+)
MHQASGQSQPLLGADQPPMQQQATGRQPLQQPAFGQPPHGAGQLPLQQQGFGQPPFGAGQPLLHQPAFHRPSFGAGSPPLQQPPTAQPPLGAGQPTYFFDQAGGQVTFYQPLLQQPATGRLPCGAAQQPLQQPAAAQPPFDLGPPRRSQPAAAQPPRGAGQQPSQQPAIAQPPRSSISASLPSQPPSKSSFDMEIELLSGATALIENMHGSNCMGELLSKVSEALQVPVLQFQLIHGDQVFGWTPAFDTRTLADLGIVPAVDGKSSVTVVMRAPPHVRVWQNTKSYTGWTDRLYQVKAAHENGTVDLQDNHGRPVRRQNREVRLVQTNGTVMPVMQR